MNISRLFISFTCITEFELIDSSQDSTVMLLRNLSTDIIMHSKIIVTRYTYRIARSKSGEDGRFTFITATLHPSHPSWTTYSFEMSNPFIYSYMLYSHKF